MKRRFRLTRSTDFERVRRSGKSYAHPLVVLVAFRSENDPLRVGVSAGRSVGSAVARNRAKRVLRACISDFIPNLACGWDLIFLARQGLVEAGYGDARRAVELLLKRAGLLKPTPGHE